MIGKWKISQNEPQQGRKRIANGLIAVGGFAIASLVESD